MRRIFFKPTPLVGMAITPQNIHLIQLRIEKKACHLARARHHQLPPAICMDGQVHDFVELQSHVRTIIETERLQQVQVAVCLLSNQVKMQRMRLPGGLSPEDIEAEVTTEANRLWMIKNEKLALDYYEYPAVTKLEMSVYYVAARKNYVSQYAACLQQAGLVTAVMDIDIFAMLRCARSKREFQSKIIMFYLLPEYAVLAAAEGDDLLFQQHWDKARVHHQYTSQIEWIEWCCHAYRQISMNHVLLCGSAELITIAADLIKKHWQCRVSEFDPFAHLNVDCAITAAERSMFSMACGLALREPCHV